MADWELMGNEEDADLPRDGQGLASPVADAAAQATAAAAGCGGCAEAGDYFSQAPMPDFGLGNFNISSGDDSGDDSGDGGGDGSSNGGGMSEHGPGGGDGSGNGGDGSGNGGGMSEYGPDGYAADGLDEYGFSRDQA
jgi:hypothetical protein